LEEINELANFDVTTFFPSFNLNTLKMSTSRREFLTHACALCAAAALAPMSLMAAPDKKKKKVKLALKNGKVVVPVKLIETRLNSFKVKGLSRELLIVNNQNTYTAFLMKCTHMGVGLNIDGDELVCPAHKSMFDSEGNVTKGPAKSSLQKFTVTQEGDELVVEVSGVE